MHIVMVCVDAMRADHIGCYRGSGTPHMDALAAGGVCFRNAIAQAPWTRPAVTSIMTGLYPSQHVMTDAPSERAGPARVIALDPAVPTLAEALSVGGYTTAAFVAGNAHLKPEFGIMRGFDHVDWLTTTDGAVVVKHFARWLETAAPAQSFTYLHLMETHNPLPKELVPSRPLVDKGVDLAALQKSEETLLRYYAESVTRADHQIGEVLHVLGSRGLEEDTWIIVTADHGEELNEHGYMLSHGQSLYRQLVWVPLIMRLPEGRHRGLAPVEPVSHVDLLPTVLDGCGLPAPAPVPGRSVLPLLEGGTEDEAFGYSELLKRAKYARSVSTSRHHLIETFHVSQALPAAPSDLVVGTRVEVKGQPVVGGAFIPTKVSIDDEAGTKLIGVIDEVDVERGVVTVMGIVVEVGPATRMVGLDKASFAISELSPGERVSVELGEGQAGGPYAAIHLLRRKSGGESKLEGVVEAVDHEGGVCLSLLGRSVPIDERRVRLVNRNGQNMNWSRYDVLQMVAEGRHAAVERQLYDIVADPAEANDLAEREPEVMERLSGRLSAWAEGLKKRFTEGREVELDPETAEQLRALGYLE